MLIGVVSDTHVPGKIRKLPDILFEKLSCVDLIIHAGDLVSQQVIDELSKLAPVKAVSGNVDPPYLKHSLPEKLRLELAGYRIGVIHGHNLRGHIMDKLSYIFPDEDIIIFGHTHKPINQKIENQLYFNPGSPTDRRLQSQHSFGIIKLGDIIESKIIYF